ncbi:MYG1 protein [Pseudozyma hubeiensis SY62]|uniref:MYG1 protein n=1 Tax=Pseudozyma hubeiensis (strain SY62) TaxID=1305764 RepID=R9PEW7_PSEHS|nr:MYG1 protein [Pseudozyma hubeiensis SY62]GAC96645.1 MYG1 protein [Pseudozyma hubeiensis SY62]
MACVELLDRPKSLNSGRVTAAATHWTLTGRSAIQRRLWIGVDAQRCTQKALETSSLHRSGPCMALPETRGTSQPLNAGQGRNFHDLHGFTQEASRNFRENLKMSTDTDLPSRHASSTRFEKRGLLDRQIRVMLVPKQSAPWCMLRRRDVLHTKGIRCTSKTMVPEAHSAIPGRACMTSANPRHHLQRRELASSALHCDGKNLDFVLLVFWSTELS